MNGSNPPLKDRVVLVTGAFLFVGSFRWLVTMNPGFRAQGILLATFDMPRQGPLLRQLLEERQIIKHPK